MNKALFVGFILLAGLRLTPSALGQVGQVALTDDGSKAFDTLLTSTQFEDRVIGVAGEPSKLVKAYNVLLKEMAADAAFKELLARATLPGQLYALCGLFFTDNSFFQRSVEKYRHSESTVSTQFGCIVSTWKVSDLVETRKPIIIDIHRPEESLDYYDQLNMNEYAQWNNHKNKKKHDRPPVGYQLDILNGGYSVLFRNR